MMSSAVASKRSTAVRKPRPVKARSLLPARCPVLTFAARRAQRNQSFLHAWRFGLHGAGACPARAQSRLQKCKTWGKKPALEKGLSAARGQASVRRQVPQMPVAAGVLAQDTGLATPTLANALDAVGFASVVVGLSQIGTRRLGRAVTVRLITGQRGHFRWEDCKVHEMLADRRRG